MCHLFCSTRIILLPFVLSFLIGVICARSRFEVFWNVPSRNCYRARIDIPLTKFSFQFNKGEDFYGDAVNTFYEKSIGLYPYYRDPKDPNSAVNGGIPQRVDMREHLSKAKADIERLIPNPSFGGVAILDFESWRPLWRLNWGSKRIYKSESVKWVKERYPHISTKSARRMATQQFNKAAFNFMVETIRLGIRLRPFAKWGFYGFPYCNYDAGKAGEIECSQAFQNYNDRLALILQESTALFPSIYLRSESETGRNYRYIHAILHETKRVAAMFNPRKFAFAFTKLAYDPYKDPAWFYVKRDVCNSVKQSSDFGLNGIIVWSTSKGMNANRCHLIANYVREHYGPFVRIVKESDEKCAQKQCSGHGQCLLEEQPYSYSVESECELFAARAYPQQRFNCECDSMFYGRFCERSRNFPWAYSWKWLSQRSRRNFP